MRICLLANRDIASNLVINKLVQALPECHFQIYLSQRVGKKNITIPGLQLLSFAEQSLFNQILFPALPISSATENNGLLSFAALQAKGIPVRGVDDLTLRADAIAASKPHLIVSVRFGQILTENIINIPEFGVLNLHSGILPHYRGVMATFWAMLNAEEQIGSTLHLIQDTGIDKGDIIAVDRQPADYQRSYFSNLVSLYQSGTQSLIEAIGKIRAEQSLSAHSQAHTEGRYYSFPGEAEIEQFQQRGLRLVDFDELVDLARQFLPQ